MKVRKLGFDICRIDVSAEKIDSNRLKTCGMIIILFQVNNKDIKSCFFKKTFLLLGIGIYITCRMLFLILSNLKDDLKDKKLK